MSGPRLLIFDFDGTLANTFPEIVLSLNQTREDFGYGTADAQTIRGWIGYGLRHFMAQAVPERDRDDATVDAFMNRYKEIYREVAFDASRLFDGIEEMLDAVASDVLALVSNKSMEQLEPMAKRLGIFERFAAVVGGDTLERAKPAREVYDYVAQVTQAESLPGWMIGDSEPDIELGKNASLTTVGCLWGLRTRDELERAGADHIVEDRRQLTDVLRP